MRGIIITALLLLFGLSGCNPVKRAMKKKQQLDAAIRDYLRDNPQPADTFYVRGDTLIRYDTIVNENIYVDTVRVADTIYITKVNWRDVLRTVSITDTVVTRIVDRSFSAGLQSELDQTKGALVGQHRSKRGWMIAAIFLASAILIYMAFKIGR